MNGPIIPKQMRAAVYRGKNDIRIETVPVPRILRDELLVKVAVCGVCPTDIKKIQAGTIEPPRIFGHETAGTIVKVGSAVSGYSIGDRVGLHHHVPCRECHYCRHQAYAQCAQYSRTGITAGFEPAGGGFAEYVRVMGFVLPGVVKLPGRVGFVQGAMLEPVNTVLKGVAQLKLIEGDTVLVVGQGPIGLLFTRILAKRGMKVVATDLIAGRRQAGRKAGAIWTGTPEQFAELRSRFPGTRSGKRTAKNTPVDAAVVTVPADSAVLDSFQWIRPAGVVLLFGHTRKGGSIAVDPGVVCVDEKSIVGSYSSDIRLQASSARFCFSEKQFIERLVTGVFSLEQTGPVIDQAASPGETGLKLMIAPALSKIRAD